MFEIPFSFKDKNEDYLIMDKLHEFCRENNVPFTGVDKVELIKSIEDFARLDKGKKNKVLYWLDKTLKEGRKKILIAKIGNIINLKNKNRSKWETLIKTSFNIKESSHIINGKNSEDIKLIGYCLTEKNEHINIVSLNFSVLLKEQKNKDLPYYTIVYPIFIDIYLDEGYIVGRSKSKSSVFRFKKGQEELEDETLDSTNCEKLIKETFEKVYLALNIEQESKEYSNHIFKSIIHFMVDECTKTPQEIINELKEEQEYREEFIRAFFKRKSINYIAQDNYDNALKDLEILMEKYLSINSDNKEIFTNDRYAYPIQISATDADFSSVEESSMEHVPLQCTPVFFDNKKLIQRQKKCDYVDFMFKRCPKKYFTNKQFPVTLEVKKGFMYIDFRKYELEEDIKNVLSRVIRDN